MTDKILQDVPAAAISPARARITAAWLRDEAEAVDELLGLAELPAAESEQIEARAAELVTRVRAKQDERSAIAAFMQKYDLS
ncbi:MAG: hypothetical protein L0H70_07055, partial [Xanthomonadales bacterium]|nr:hypothetical protein [Xanthomonadales bacterium]